MTEEIVVTDQYAGPNRRRYSKTLEQIEEDIKQMLEDHEEKEREWIGKLIDSLKTEAFPNGDLEGHCGYHDSRIKAAQAEEEFYKTAKQALVTNGVSALFAVGKFLLIMALLGMAYKLGLGPAAAKLFGVA